MKLAKFTPGYEASFRLLEGFLELLERRGMKRSALARKLGVDRSVVTKWFSPNRNLTVFTAAMIADALGADLRFELVDRCEAANEAPASETVQGLPAHMCEYRKVSSPPSHSEAAELTAAVSMPRPFGRGIEREATSLGYLPLPV